VENLQLRSAFLGKPLIKTYVALRESCRSIAPLQLCFWEIFHLVDDFWSFAISKRAKRNKIELGDVVLALQSATRVPAASATWRGRVAPAYGPVGDSAVDRPCLDRSASPSAPYTAPREKGRQVVAMRSDTRRVHRRRPLPPPCRRLYNWPRRRRITPTRPPHLSPLSRSPAGRAGGAVHRRRGQPEEPAELTPPLVHRSLHLPPRARAVLLHAPAWSLGLQSTPTPSSGGTGGRPRGGAPPTPKDPISTRETTSNHPTKVSRSPRSGSPAKSGRPRPPISPPARADHQRTTLQERSSFQGDLCKISGTRL
jgi:hypothetical protein